MVNISITLINKQVEHNLCVLDIKIRAGGDVYIYGDPKKVNESKALGGRIKRMN